MLVQQENKSSESHSNKPKRNEIKGTDTITFDEYASQLKIKPYPEPRGPLANDVVLGGSLPSIATPAQRKTKEEEHSLQGKNIQLAKEEEEPLQGKFGKTPNNTGLPDNLRAGIENLSGMSMDGVKVHYNSDKPAKLNALAYAQGSDIHVGSGQEQHLPHEAWHIAQQKQGLVRPTMQMNDGVAVNDDKGLEHEADVMGAKAASEDVAQPKQGLSYSQESSQPLQRMAIYPDEIGKIDNIICADLKLQHDRAGGASYNWNEMDGLANQSLTINEGIILVGHGDPGKIQHKDANTLADMLKKKVSDVKNIKYIYISACMSAAKDASGSTLAQNLAAKLGIDGSKTAGTVGYKVNNIDSAIDSAVYHITTDIKADVDLAFAINNALVTAYNLNLYAHPKEAASTSEAEAYGGRILEENSDFHKFLSNFGKAMSGNVLKIEEVKADIKKLKLANENEVLRLLELAKAKKIAKTDLTTGAGAATSYNESTK